MTRTTLLIVLLLVVGLSILPATTTEAVDFRVENSIFVEKEKSVLSPSKKKEEKPSSQGTTIFYREAVYDFIDNPAEVIIFDPASERFILLDVERKLRTELTPTVVRQSIDRLKRLAKDAKTDRARFMFDPKFDETVDAETGELVFESKWLTYRVTGVKPDDPAIVRQYREFSDWYAQLNTFLRPNSPPPFARMFLNEVLAKREEVPSQIEVTHKIPHGLTVKKEKLWAEYRFIKRLVESDMRRIAQAGEQMAAFKQVDFRQYEARLRADENKTDKDAPKPKE